MPSLGQAHGWLARCGTGVTALAVGPLACTAAPNAPLHADDADDDLTHAQLQSDFAASFLPSTPTTNSHSLRAAVLVTHRRHAV